MKSKLLFIILIAALGGLAYYAYPIVKDRYFSQPEDKTIIINEPEEASAPFTPEESEEEAGILEDTGKIQEEQQTLKEEGKIFQKITADDCDSECADFSGGELEYCKEVCGLVPLRQTFDGCENLPGLQKDYCLKDLAVSKKDFGACDQISDSNVKKTCQNRVTEDLLDESMGSEELPE